MKHVIIIEQNCLKDYEDENICIYDKKITFKKNGEYTLEYVNSDNIYLDFVLLDDVMVKLFICSKGQQIDCYHRYSLGDNSNLVLFQFYYNKNVKEKKNCGFKWRKFSFLSSFF